MGLFKSSKEREMDILIERIEMNMSNNYKDAAQENLKEFTQKLEAAMAEGKMKEKSLKYYEGQLDTFKERMKGFTHKDQKPFWT